MKLTNIPIRNEKSLQEIKFIDPKGIPNDFATIQPL